MKKKDWVLPSITWLFAALILFVTTGPFTSPALMPDELCFLGWSRFLSGGEFYSMGTASYCHPSYPALLAAFHWATDTPAEAYRTALLLNCAMAAACLPLAAIIAMRHFNVPRLQAWATGLLATMYPAMVAYTRYAWPEALLYLLALAWLLAWCRLVEQPSTGRKWVWLAVSIAAYFAHPRMLALPMVAVTASFLWWLRHRDSATRQQFFLATFATLAAVGLMSSIKAWAMPSGLPFETVVPVGKLDIVSTGTLVAMLARFGGQLCFALLATAGLAWLPLAWSADAAVRPGTDTRFLLKVAAAPAALLALTGISALFLAESPRFDTYFYGRYAGPAILMSLVVGMAVIGRKQDARRWPFWMLLLAVACLLPLELAPPSDPDVDYSSIHVIGARPLVDWLKPQAGTAAFQWIVAGIVMPVALLACLLARTGWRWSALSAAALFMALHASGESRRTSDMAAHLPQGELAGLLARDSCRIVWDAGIKERTQNHQAYRLQYAYPGCRLEFAGADRCEKIGAGTIFVTDSKATYPCGRASIRSYPLKPGLKAYVAGDTP